MADDDRERWNERYGRSADPAARPIIPAVPIDFADHAHRFPTSGRALEPACGTGAGSLWLAGRGLDVTGVDVSSVAVDVATAAARRLDLADRCRFVVADLDDGLPDTPPVDLIMCHRFRNPTLYEPMVARLAVGGVLAIAVLSEVGSAPGRFRAVPGELREAFGDRLDVLVDSEGAGTAVLIGIKSG
ncbi:MAG: methyltransferase domain-containing protein [Acidimicrobiia bacterium]|nr:methyltransferase domain-containing protein [Acidimicrobiia bacterium]